MTRHLRAFTVLVGLTAGGLTLGGSLASRAMAEGQDYYESLEVFSQVMHRIRQDYVEAVDVDRLVQGAIKGMIGTLDPYSQYMTPKQYQEFREETSGDYFGIGVEISQEQEGLRIVAPYPGSPAEKAGLLPGDLILRVEGDDISKIGTAEAVGRIKGRKGTKVLLGIKREGWKEIKDIPVERDQIHTPAVASQLLEPGIGYVRIFQFQERVTAEVQKAIKDLSKPTAAGGGPIKALVMDLRNNPGGLLDEAVELADLFIEQGTLVSTRGRGEDEVKKARRGGTLEPFPLVVLVNDGSASASEIVAGALQDHKRAVVVGEPSYGKGSVQNIIALENKGALRLTVARYYTPNGRPIDRDNSIVPDVLVSNERQSEEDLYGETDSGATILRDQKLDVEKDPQLKEAVAQLKKQLMPGAKAQAKEPGGSASPSSPR